MMYRTNLKMLASAMVVLSIISASTSPSPFPQTADSDTTVVTYRYQTNPTNEVTESTIGSIVTSSMISHTNFGDKSTEMFGIDSTVVTNRITPAMTTDWTRNKTLSGRTPLPAVGSPNITSAKNATNRTFEVTTSIIGPPDNTSTKAPITTSADLSIASSAVSGLTAAMESTKTSILESGSKPESTGSQSISTWNIKDKSKITTTKLTNTPGRTTKTQSTSDAVATSSNLSLLICPLLCLLQHIYTA